ncbi:MAG: hypothetical protein JWN04_203 [Myxococcaceae bacterium]|nr:hypothetical protein [Myxococcaceae bacterium]
MRLKSLSIRTLMGVAAAGCVALIPTFSRALPGGSVDWGVISPREETTGTRTLDVGNGLYVIGDSISMSPGTPRDKPSDNPTGFPLSNPPYSYIAQQNLVHKKVAVRALGGATVADFRVRTGWPGSGGNTTVADVLASNARVVYIELGTNDVSCMHRSTFVPPGPDGVEDGASVDTCDQLKDKGNLVIPADTDAGYTAWRDAQRAKIKSDALALINDLVSANRCVIWAGPREINIYGSRAEDYAWFNNVLKAYATTKPGFHYANLDLYAKNTPALTADWGKDWDGKGLNVHPQTGAAAYALAQFAILGAATKPGSASGLFPTGGCGIDG